MKKHITRKRLLQELTCLAECSSFNPIATIKIYFANACGDPDFDSAEKFYDMDKMAGRLMDLSLTHRITKSDYVKFMFQTGMAVSLVLAEDKDYRTNIDDEVVELLMKMKWSRGNDDSGV